MFDGPPPTGPRAEQIADERIEVRYAADRTADEVIVEAIAADTGPRDLAVVSTDREIRRAAGRRRCRVVRSEDFADELIDAMNAPPRPEPTEPPEKRHGLSPEETDAWLEELNIDTSDLRDPEEMP